MNRRPPFGVLPTEEPTAYADGYERLRRHAVEPGVEHDRHGSAVVALRGLTGWLHAFADLPAPPACVRADASAEPLPVGVQSPAIDILIAMLNGHMGAVTA